MVTASATKSSKKTARKPTAVRVVRRTPSKSTVVKAAVKRTPVRTVGKKPAPVKTVKVASSTPRPLTPTPAKKVKLVRDSFSFPEHEHALLADIKKRALKLGTEFKKSEILRAGIAHLASLADGALLTLLSKVDRVKTGRPAKKSKKK